MRSRALALAWAVAGMGALAVTGCMVTKTFKLPPDGGSDATPVCPGGIPQVKLSAASPTCVGELAARTFRFALCSCVDQDLDAGFRTDSYDSSVGVYMSADAARSGAGSVGVNGQVSILAGAEVLGSLISAGTGSSTIGDSETIHGDLKTNGDLVLGNTVFVVRDAWIRGTITAPDKVIIGGDLIQPPVAAPPPAGLVLGGQQRVNDFTVAPPCACAPTDDLLTAIKDARMSNDNALIGMDPDGRLDGQGGAEMRLPCGRFYFAEMAGSSPLNIVVQGHAVMFVGGNFVAWDGLTVQFAPGAQLDVFVGGNFTLGTASTFGDPSHAAALRFYVAGANASMAGASVFAGNLYAPAAAVDTNAIDIFGSVLASGLLPAQGQGVAIHFDRAVLNAAAACSVDTTPRACDLCSDCQGTNGCVAGYCTACKKAEDCCDPLVCMGGRCQAFVSGPG